MQKAITNCRRNSMLLLIVYLRVFGKAVNLESKKIQDWICYILSFLQATLSLKRQYMLCLSSKSFRISHSKCVPCKSFLKTSHTSQGILFVLLHRSGKETDVLPTNNMQFHLLASPRGAVHYVGDSAFMAEKKIKICCAK